MTVDLKNEIKKVVQQMVELRKKIHICPEPAFEEVETAATIVRNLEKIEQLEIVTGVGKTGVTAVLGREKTGPCIALRADMDCLRMCEENSFAHASKKEGLMHGCGHDGHIACLVGAAVVLGKMQRWLKGPVKFIFQPAEENYGGANEMIKDGVLLDPVPRAIFGLHGTPSLPLGRIGLRNGPMMAASRYFNITVTGMGTHAAMPHKGIDSVMVASHIVCAAHSIVSRNINPLEAALISIPIFNGSTAPNVIPREVKLQGTLRALSEKNISLLEKRLEEVVVQTATAFGAEAKIEFDGGYPLLENDRKCVDYLVNIGEQVVGKDNIQCEYPPSMGAEDFAFYLKKTPGAFWWLGLGNKEIENIPLHNPKFDFNDCAIPVGIHLHCLSALNSNLL